MTPPVNLNRVRKAKTRADADAKAAENRARFGRTKAERKLQDARTEKTARDLDAGKRER